MTDKQAAAVPVFKLFMSAARDEKGSYEPRAVYLCHLTGPDGFDPVTFGADPAFPILTRERDPLYAGFLDALGRVPDGCHVQVVTVDQYLHGASTDAGTFNTTPAEREARLYLRQDPKGGPLANEAQLREIDAALTARRITTAAARPEAGEEVQRHSRIRWEVKELLKVDPSGKPSERGL